MKTEKPPIAPVDERAYALASILKDKGLISDEYINKLESTFESWTPENGARIVAKAWSDEAYRKRLLADGTAACAELGFGGDEGGFIVAVENTAQRHNVIVCTLCSCTAWPILGLPPEWYKSFEYRSRVVREPRQVLRELGCELPEKQEILVWDTTAETRYMGSAWKTENILR
ncbi:nitrile hydratase subunit alpha [Kluyvera intermedia]|uniref:Nitrile hydratase subunit alpha n=1 Tax=Kluyvera intermedia TaxID=61648 RepID=A0AA95FZL8_KLUIN|nr:nitrile hydratase subunit alpha [Kluyvera intermedia]WGL54961.1 nitrile hydratase subunit alpha [Kluyvera intermedia]